MHVHVALVGLGRRPGDGGRGFPRGGLAAEAGVGSALFWIRTRRPRSCAVTVRSETVPGTVAEYWPAALVKTLATPLTFTVRSLSGWFCAPSRSPKSSMLPVDVPVISR